MSEFLKNTRPFQLVNDIIVNGVKLRVAAITYAKKTAKILFRFKEHRKNKSKKNYDKHTKRRPGRKNEKKRLKPGWKQR